MSIGNPIQAMHQSLPAEQAEALLRELAQWGNTTTIIQHGGCVFEFKGPFPPGTVAEGYYNLDGPVPGFHGHIRLAAIARIGFQVRNHRGRVAYAFTFDDAHGDNLFKVFVGRDADGEPIAEQVLAFERIRATGHVV